MGSTCTARPASPDVLIWGRETRGPLFWGDISQFIYVSDGFKLLHLVFQRQKRPPDVVSHRGSAKWNCNVVALDEPCDG